MDIQVQSYNLSIPITTSEIRHKNEQRKCYLSSVDDNLFFKAGLIQPVLLDHSYLVVLESSIDKKINDDSKMQECTAGVNMLK